MIAGEGSSKKRYSWSFDDDSSDVELVSMQTNNDLCDPLDLDYTVDYHASIGTPDGILTCGGTSDFATSKCVLQTKEGQTTAFPSMKRARTDFGLGIVNDTIYAVGGAQGPATMEKINFKIDSNWTMTNLQFSVTYHCVATTTKNLVVTGGYGPVYPVEGVSKIILSL